jgi:hypothetical protein
MQITVRQIEEETQMSENHGRDPHVLAAQLRAWTREHDLHVRAAVELLVDHGAWLRRAGFARACVGRDGREAWIDWATARRYAGSGPGGSTSELAILGLAVALGENRYRLSIMAEASARLIATAVARAVGAGR